MLSKAEHTVVVFPTQNIKELSFRQCVAIRRPERGLRSIAAGCTRLHTLNVALSPGLCAAMHDAATAMAHAGLPLRVLVLNRCEVTDDTVRAVLRPIVKQQ